MAKLPPDHRKLSQVERLQAPEARGWAKADPVPGGGIVQEGQHVGANREGADPSNRKDPLSYIA